MAFPEGPRPITHNPRQEDITPPAGDGREGASYRGFVGKRVFIVVVVVFGLLFPDGVYTLMHWTG
jgi:hypothetical protein